MPGKLRQKGSWILSSGQLTSCCKNGRSAENQGVSSAAATDDIEENLKALKALCYFFQFLLV